MAKRKTTEHSAKFEQIKEWYDNVHWTAKMVANAVVKGKITAEEYEEITGERYSSHPTTSL